MPGRSQHLLWILLSYGLSAFEELCSPEDRNRAACYTLACLRGGISCSLPELFTLQCPLCWVLSVPRCFLLRGSPMDKPDLTQWIQFLAIRSLSILLLGFSLGTFSVHPSILGATLYHERYQVELCIWSLILSLSLPFFWLCHWMHGLCVPPCLCLLITLSIYLSVLSLYSPLLQEVIQDLGKSA